MIPEIRKAVLQAISDVNAQPGQTSVHLRFNDDPLDVDFVANSASMQGAAFEFQAGFETYGGSIDELSDIKTETIRR